MKEKAARCVHETSDTNARMKRLRILPPELSGKADPDTPCHHRFLPFSDFHAFMLNNHAKIDSSWVRLGSQGISAGFTASNFDNSKMAGNAFQTFCVDPVFQSICERHSSSKISVMLWMKS